MSIIVYQPYDVSNIHPMRIEELIKHQNTMVSLSVEQFEELEQSCPDFRTILIQNSVKWRVNSFFRRKEGRS